MADNLSTKYYKYPRTPHLPWSQGVNADDKLLKDISFFTNKQVIVTEKMDGENTTLYQHYLHARSIDSRHHPSRNWIKAFHAKIAHLIPAGWRFCGENLYARHSIAYNNLDSYFYLFSIWNEKNECLPWDITLEWAQLIGLSIPPTLYEGLWNVEIIKKLSIDISKSEGYVVRTFEGFNFRDFSKCCAKWVRKNHVQDDKHWMHQIVTPNQVKSL